MLRKFQNILPRPAHLTIYKCFIKPHLDYGDIIYDQAYNLYFHQKLESIQYNPVLALAGAIRVSSREKLYQELGLESLQLRQYYRKLCCFYKIYNKQVPGYFVELIPTCNEAYQTRHFANAPFLRFRYNSFKKHFSISYHRMEQSPSPNNISQCDKPRRFKFVTRLRLDLSLL